MEITRITDQNVAAFEELMPDGLWEKEDEFCLGAVNDAKEAVACMCSYIYKNIIKIDWLYTLPKWREQGAATELVDTLVALVNDMDIKVIEITFDEDREELEDFLLDRGFVVGFDANIYRVPISDLMYSREMDWFLEDAKLTGKLISLKDASAHSMMKDLLSKEGMEEMIDNITPELSFIRTDKNNSITGGMLLREVDESDIEVVYFLSDGGATAAVDYILGLYELVGTDKNADRFLTFVDTTEGSAIRMIEELTGEEREKYSINGPLRGVFPVNQF